MTQPAEPIAVGLVRAFLHTFENQDLEAALAMVTEDVEYDNVPIGKVYGPDGIRSVVSGSYSETADRVEWVVARAVGSGDTVFVERRDRFYANGRWLEIPVAGLFQLRDGKIALWRDYFDLATWKQQAAGHDS